jgi:hypothetical protein
MDFLFDAIGTDVAATIRAIPGIKNCAYPPPESANIMEGPSTWVDLGPTAFSLGSLEIAEILVTITVAVPRKGDYPGEYKLVLDYARRITIAFRGNIVVGNAVIMNPATISKPIAARFGDETSNIVACQITFTVQAETETVNDLFQ